jgi:hypothetical protein
VGRDLQQQASFFWFLEMVRNLAGGYAVNGTERLFSPMESPLWRGGSVLSEERYLRHFWSKKVNTKGVENEKDI